MKRVKYVGNYPMEVLPYPGAITGKVRQPGEEFDVEDDAVADDLLRRQDYFMPVEAPRPEPRSGIRRGMTHGAGS